MSISSVSMSISSFKLGLPIIQINKTKTFVSVNLSIPFKNNQKNCFKTRVTFLKTNLLRFNLSNDGLDKM